VNILFLSQRVPDPPNKGDKIRSHHLARRLAANHTVHVACLADDERELETAGLTRRWAASVACRVRTRAESVLRGAASALSGRPLSVGYFRSRELAADVTALLATEPFDVAVSYCSSMASYLSRFAGPRVLDLVDVDSEKWRQYAVHSRLPSKAVYALEHRLLRNYEKRLVEEFDRTIVISQAEKSLLTAFAPGERVEVIANGVETEYWRNHAARSPEPVLVFVGALDYFANADGICRFTREAFPRVRAEVADARLRIVGRRPGADVRALGALPGVEVVGEVADVRPELWGAGVAVVPLRIAQGLQNKVLEALAAGVPVVSSAAAVRGIRGRSEQHYLVAESAAESAAAVVRVLRDRALGDGLAERGRLLVQEGYSWDRSEAEYEAVLEAAIASRTAESGGGVP
jgi:sugar transferase (PEP-CTERM/EpsH1 system associated)